MYAEQVFPIIEPPRVDLGGVVPNRCIRRVARFVKRQEDHVAVGRCVHGDAVGHRHGNVHHAAYGLARADRLTVAGDRDGDARLNGTQGCRGQYHQGEHDLDEGTQHKAST